MKQSVRGWLCCLVAACSLTFALAAQTAPAPAGQQTPARPAEANPFPEDSTGVPVMPDKGAPVLPPETEDGAAASAFRIPLPAVDTDPVRSPDSAGADSAAASSDSANELSSSSSSSGLDKVLGDPDADDAPTGKHRKLAVPGPEHKETAAEDIQVGKYYIESKNWKAAQPRFQSAMVLSPDDPDVYWGLAESARHLGQLAEARGFYQKLAEYDPDSRHGKDALKALKDPQIANAKATLPADPAK